MGKKIKQKKLQGPVQIENSVTIDTAYRAIHFSVIRSIDLTDVLFWTVAAATLQVKNVIMQLHLFQFGVF